MELCQKLNEEIKKLLSSSDEPMYQYAAARIEDLEKKLAEYRTTGLTPEQIQLLFNSSSEISAFAATRELEHKTFEKYAKIIGQKEKESK